MVDTVIIPTQDTQPTLEQEAAALEAAAAGDGKDPKLAGEADTPERPSWLPEKFQSPEDMARAYAELEGKLGAPKEAEKADEAAEQAVNEAGLDMNALADEYAEKGELSSASYDALAKVGITKEMVDVYIAGQEAQQNAVRDSLLAPVGGQEAYDEMIGWASDNLSNSEIEAFNSVLGSGDVNAMRMAVENLNAKYTRAVGQEPNRQLAGKPTGAGTSVYESTADLMKDMSNPEYERNPAFRAKVEAKLARSSIL